MNYQYHFDFKRQAVYGVIGFVLALITVNVFESEWKVGIALGIGLGNFISSGFLYKNCK